jgi:hypothetical protein
MAVDRQRLAAALAYEEERRRRMMESVPTTDNLPPVQPTRRSLRTDLENLSSGIGQGVVNQLEGVKALVTDPVGTARAAYEGVKGIVRDPSVLADALRYTAQKATSGPLGAGEVIGEMIGPMRGKGPIAEIDVYHGSPHRFEEFDASKIGTGEGAQAYGHGIYLAESPNVAKGYQKQLAQIKPEMTVEFGLPITGKSKKFAETALQSSSGDADSAIKNLRENLQFYSSVEAKNAATEAINALKTAKITWGKDYPIGHFYTADLPDEMVDRMLDYDKPLKDQPAAYQAIRSMIPADVVKDFDANVEKGITGGNAYSNWVWGGKTPAGRSEKLRQSGIVGIKYADAGSRGQGGSGTRNFVVFPGEEKKVKILKRE